MPLGIRISFAALVAALLVAWFVYLDRAGGPSRELATSLAFGCAFGIVLQRARFCFLCNFRDWLNAGDGRGLIAILIALAIGAAGYAAVFGAWMPVPTPGRLPPDAHIGPISWALPFAAAVFGLGMVVSGSCLSAHLYRLGEGSPTSPFALIGALGGFALGFYTWNTLYLAMVAEAAPVWLPHSLGYAGTLGLTLIGLALLAALVLWRSRPQATAHDNPAPALRSGLQRVFVTRWPAAVGGVLIGLIGTLAYFRVAPLGVTAEIGSIARTAGASAGLLPETLHGLDGFRGCATVIKNALLSVNGVFVLGLVGASFASALAAGMFRPAVPSMGQIGRGLLGGVLMGWGAMTALGCTIGVLLSGIQAGAVAGWVFLVFCVGGALAGLRIRKPLGLN
jgi:uncharacterized protein